MKYDVDTVEDYIAAIPEERRPAIKKLREVILSNLPDGFEEQMLYGMISYVVPLSIYPKGYHVKKDEPLPFISLASQKHHIALYHMGLYGNSELKTWFEKEYAERVATKLDMAKICIRFKKIKSIPYDLIAELCQQMAVADYINYYEQSLRKGYK